MAKNKDGYYFYAVATIHTDGNVPYPWIETMRLRRVDAVHCLTERERQVGKDRQVRVCRFFVSLVKPTRKP